MCEQEYTKTSKTKQLIDLTSQTTLQLFVVNVWVVSQHWSSLMPYSLPPMDAVEGSALDAQGKRAMKLRAVEDVMQRMYVALTPLCLMCHVYWIVLCALC